MKASRGARWLALAALATLAGVIAGWYGWAAAASPATVAVLLVPLMLPLRGLLRGTPYTYAWTSMLALFYLLLGATEGLANPAVRAWAIATFCLALLLFTACVYYVRFDARERARAAAQPGSR